MAACDAETTISMEMDSELEESDILQCTLPSIAIQFNHITPLIFYKLWCFTNLSTPRYSEISDLFVTYNYYWFK